MNIQKEIQAHTALAVENGVVQSWNYSPYYYNSGVLVADTCPLVRKYCRGPEQYLRTVFEVTEGS